MNALVYAMGDEADDILKSFHLSEGDLKYKTVKEKFDDFHKTAKCDLREGQRKQEPQESVDSFITSLHFLVEHCSYGELYDEMIRDCIVVGLRDASITQKLQMDPKLTLDKAVTLA